ncbi:MAG: DUF2062 domain-containing protein [Vicinamibacterales bacterium]
MLPARFKGWLEQLLHTHDTPHRTALAYAVGVFFGFSPILGLHTILGIAVAFVFGLNRIAVVLGIYSNLPWILPAYYTVTTLLGAFILRVEVPPGLLRELTDSLRDASWGEFRRLAHALWPLAWAFVVGSTLGAITLAAVAYRTSLRLIVAHRRRHGLDQTGPTSPQE